MRSAGCSAPPGPPPTARCAGAWKWKFRSDGHHRSFRTHAHHGTQPRVVRAGQTGQTPRGESRPGAAHPRAASHGAPTMQGDTGVIDYLNQGLRHELTSINQYWLHYRLLENWGFRTLAKKWRQESIEEMQHADKLIERIIFLEGSHNMQTLGALHIGHTVKEVIEHDLQAEL